MSEARYYLVMPCDWERIEQVRRSVGPCLRTIYGNRAICDAVAMSSAELLENAMKHGAAEQGLVHFSLKAAEDGVTLRVRNPAQGQPATREALRAVIEWINSFEDPYQAYVARLTEICEQGGGEGGLGLVRIAYEGRARIQCYISTNGIEVEAIFTHLED